MAELEDTVHDSKLEFPESPARRKFLGYAFGKFLTGFGAFKYTNGQRVIGRQNKQKNTSQPQNSGVRTSTAPVNSPLEARMDAFIKEKRASGFLKQTDEISVTVYDITKNNKYASINEDKKRMAASTIKDFVMLAMFHQIKSQQINYTPRIKQLLENSIQHSSNIATNNLMKFLGGPSRIQNILATYYPFFNETKVVEYIPPQGRTYRNITSTHDLSIFYNQMWHNNLPYSAEMRRILNLPKKDRLFDGTCIPKGTRVLNKTGTVYGLVADSGILIMKGNKGDSHPYIVNVIIEDKTKPHARNRKGAGSWTRRRSDFIRELSEGVYDYLYKAHTGMPYHCKQHNGVHFGGRQ